GVFDVRERTITARVWAATHERKTSAATIPTMTKSAIAQRTRRTTLAVSHDEVRDDEHATQPTLDEVAAPDVVELRRGYAAPHDDRAPRESRGRQLWPPRRTGQRPAGRLLRHAAGWHADD